MPISMEYDAKGGRNKYRVSETFRPGTPVNLQVSRANMLTAQAVERGLQPPKEIIFLDNVMLFAFDDPDAATQFRHQIIPDAPVADGIQVNLSWDDGDNMDSAKAHRHIENFCKRMGMFLHTETDTNGDQAIRVSARYKGDAEAFKAAWDHIILPHSRDGNDEALLKDGPLPKKLNELMTACKRGTVNLPAVDRVPTFAGGPQPRAA